MLNPYFKINFHFFYNSISIYLPFRITARSQSYQVMGSHGISCQVRGILRKNGLNFNLLIRGLNEDIIILWTFALNSTYKQIRKFTGIILTVYSCFSLKFFNECQNKEFTFGFHRLFKKNSASFLYLFIFKGVSFFFPF